MNSMRLQRGEEEGSPGCRVWRKDAALGNSKELRSCCRGSCARGGEGPEWGSRSHPWGPVLAAEQMHEERGQEQLKSRMGVALTCLCSSHKEDDEKQSRDENGEE